jgi:hypothetical protein
MLADELIQPILHSYTIESLARLTESCGLEIILPCLNQFDKTEMKYSWNIGFDNPSLKETYDSLPDLHRWQVTNLLMREKSPQLWFYLQRKDAERLRVSEKEVCERFLDTKFVRAKTVQRSYFHQNDGRYTLSPTTHLFPTCPPDDCVKSIAEASDGRSTIREIFQRLGIDASFRSVNQARLKLTTRAFPYLRSVEFR